MMVSALHFEHVLPRYSSCALIVNSDSDEIQIEREVSWAAVLDMKGHHDCWWEIAVVVIEEVEEYSEHSSMASVD